MSSSAIQNPRRFDPVALTVEEGSARKRVEKDSSTTRPSTTTLLRIKWSTSLLSEVYVSPWTSLRALCTLPCQPHRTDGDGASHFTIHSCIPFRCRRYLIVVREAMRGRNWCVCWSGALSITSLTVRSSVHSDAPWTSCACALWSQTAGGP